MSKISVKNGKQTLTLRKSRSLVGIKSHAERGLGQADYIDSERHQHLGGFRVVSVKKEGKDLDERLDELRRLDEVELGTHVYFAEGSNRPLVPTGELFIEFEEGVGEEEQAIALDEFQLDLVERRGPLMLVARVSSRSPNPLKVAAALQAVSLVRRAEPDLDAPLDSYEYFAPIDNLLAHQWHLENSGFVFDTHRPIKPGADARVVPAWRRLGNMGSPDITIAVIDNGFDLQHPDLRNKVVHPFDLWTQSTQLVQGDAHYTHGTPCASVALAEANGQGIVGAAPRARFMPVSGTSFSVRATEQMFEHCIRYGADIISCSWGTTDPNFALNAQKAQAISRAAREGRGGKGCVIVFAVGNDNLDWVNFYATHPEVIAVAASTSRDEHATYSNRGREVSICAPSNGDWPIIAARAWWDPGMNWEQGNYRFWRDGQSRGDYYQHFGGTSSAAPLVAGICALVLSANPGLSAREVKEILQMSAEKIGSPGDYINGHSRRFGYGRINADQAVAEALRRRRTTAQPHQVLPANQPPANPAPAGATSTVWGVQTGAFSNYGNAQLQGEQLRRRFGQSTAIEQANSQGRAIYKLIVGQFPDQEGASRFLLQLQQGGINGFVVKMSKTTGR